MSRTIELRAAKGSARLTRYAKHLIASEMYQDGLQFLGAALLLRREGGSPAVVLHLICQALELVLKGLLLLTDYDHYQPMLKRPLGHHLVRLATEISKYSGLRIAPNIASELEELNRLYSSHRLRYASAHRLLVNPATIPHERLLRRFGALVRLVRRKRLA